MAKRRRRGYLPNASYAERMEFARNHPRTLERDGYQCVICGSSKRLEVDHKVPRWLWRKEGRKGSPHDTGNLQTLCRHHHIAKTRRENARRTEAVKGGEDFAEGLREQFLSGRPRPLQVDPKPKQNPPVILI